MKLFIYLFLFNFVGIKVFAESVYVNPSMEQGIIQQYLHESDSVLFENGTYYFDSVYTSERVPFRLVINGTSKVKYVKFDVNSRIVIRDKFFAIDFPYAGNNLKQVFLLIEAKNKDIFQLTIDGLNLIDSSSIPSIVTGIFANEETGFFIKNLMLSNCQFTNLKGEGIRTGALLTNINNLKTSELKGISVSAITPYNIGIKHILLIDGFVSNNDSYVIDFGGTNEGISDQFSDSREEWYGSIRNVQIKNAWYNAIKTAGFWDLDMENVNIDGCYNGFFVNKNAPGKKIRFINMSIKNCKQDCISFQGKTEFSGKGLTIENFTDVGLNFNTSRVEIDGLVVKGGLDNCKSVLFNDGGGTIRNFRIEIPNSDEFSFWIQGPNFLLKDGVIIQDDKKIFIIQKNASYITIDNVKIKKFNGDQRLLNHETYSVSNADAANLVIIQPTPEE